MTVQLGADVVALFLAAFVAAIAFGVLIGALFEEHHYRDYHK